MKRKNNNKKSRAEKKNARFRMCACNEIELRILIYLSDARFDYETRTNCRRHYWSKIIRRHCAALGIRVLKNGNVEIWAADDIHGMARLTLVCQGGSTKNPGRTLGILGKDISFFLNAFCSNRWHDLMAYFEECRDHGTEEWKRGCGLYQEYLQLINKT